MQGGAGRPVSLGAEPGAGRVRSCLRRAAAGPSTPSAARGGVWPGVAAAPGRPQRPELGRPHCGRPPRAWLGPPSGAGHRPYRLLCLLPSGRVCPSVDSHVLSVPGGPLLHRVVCPVPAFHGCDCRTAKDTHNNGTELDDHRRASPYF